MFETEQQRKDFCKQFNISDDRFRNSQLTWEELDSIAKDFNEKRNEHQDTVKRYAEIIQKCPYVHSLSYRVKEVSHLVEKIIRKNPKQLEKGDAITISNYEDKITDLMGIRVLLLFKEDWLQVHEYLLENYGSALLELPFVHVRVGDDTSLYEGKIEIRQDKPYRSAHYVLGTENGIGIEIQVRTLYEEAWSEIDHKLRYPYNLTDQMLTNYINIMNRITGVGDEMGSFVHEYIKRFQDGLFEGVADDNEVYQFIIKEIDKCDNEEIKEAIKSKINQADNYRKSEKMSNLLNGILKYE